MNIISQIVDRCHVGNSNLFVIRYVISRLKNKYRTFKAMPKDQRRKIMQEAIRIHEENKAEYRRVMSGRF